jgi:hypothetical protein
MSCFASRKTSVCALEAERKSEQKATYLILVDPTTDCESDSSESYYERGDRRIDE